MNPRSSIPLVLAVCIAACGGSTPGSPDASAPDDAGSVRDDAATVDGGGDSTDADGDGVPASDDCDDSDAAITNSAERACASACGSGVERCTSGAWAACDAPTDCACDEEGSTRLAPCERCGTRSERCAGGVWEAASVCTGQGSCELADVEERMTERCGTEQRICGETCEWGEWETVVADGECVPDSYQPCPDNLTLWIYCQPDCQWEETCR